MNYAGKFLEINNKILCDGCWEIGIAMNRGTFTNGDINISVTTVSRYDVWCKVTWKNKQRNQLRILESRILIVNDENPEPKIVEFFERISREIFSIDILNHWFDIVVTSDYTGNNWYAYATKLDKGV